MLEREVVNQKLRDVFGNDYATETIFEGKDKALILIETQKDYALVSISDLWSYSIGDYEVFVETRIQKSGNHLKDMANIIYYLQTDTIKNVDYHQRKIADLTKEIEDATKGLNNILILSKINSKA